MMTRERVDCFLEITGMTISRLAQHCGMSNSQLYYFIHGERNVSEKNDKAINGFIDSYVNDVAKLARI